MTFHLSTTVRVGAAYGTAVGSLFLAELLLSRAQSREDFGEYQLLRQLIPLVVVLALMGIDQALLRRAIETDDLSPFPRRAIRSAAVALAIGMAAALLLSGLFQVSTATFIAVTFAPPLAVLSELGAAALRAKGDLVRAALLQQAYRLLAAATLVVLCLIGATTTVATSLALLLSCVAAGVGGIAVLTPLRGGDSTQDTDAAMVRMGFGFGMSMLVFAATDWLDQAMVSRRFDSVAAGGDYAAFKLIYIYPAIAISSIVGFVALPHLVKDRHQLTTSRVRKSIALSLLGSTIFCGALGAVLAKYGGSIIQRSAPIQAIALLTGAAALRLAYVYPSAVLGAIGTTKSIVHASAWASLAILLLAAAMTLLPDAHPVLVGSAAAMLATTYRYGTSVLFALRGTAAHEQRFGVVT